MAATSQVDVWLHDDPVRVGTAWFHHRGSVTTTFTYDPGYLSEPHTFAIDPRLPLTSGTLYVPELPGAFEDCSPDRWGRNLIEKRHRSRPATAATAQRDLTAIDFLLGVSDATRQGALRFTLPGSDVFLDPATDVPKLIDLKRLLRAADHVATDPDHTAAIRDLLDAGSGSLGGARPKASVLDDGQLWIAKFPHRSDEWDMSAWEATVLELAMRAGIPVPGHRLIDIDGRHVLLLARFDRRNGRRIPYWSAMTLLESVDGDYGDYIDVAEYLADVSAGAADDLRDLFRRVAFSCAVHNTDDHLRNHGFLERGGGWRLAPLFDVNPNPALHESRVTGIAGATHPSDEPAGLTQLAAACRLDQDEAKQITNEVASALRGWRGIAARQRIPAAEIDRFAPVFDRPLALAS